MGDTKNTEGVPKSLKDLTRGCQILGGAMQIPYDTGTVWGPPYTGGLGQTAPVSLPLSVVLVAILAARDVLRC